jgi:hypothetical protein
VKRKGAKPRQRQADTRPRREPDAQSESVFPMEVQVGDRFTDHGFEWEVMTHPAALHGAKSLRARVQRPGLPESEREVTWPAHERITVRRRPRSEQ